MVEPLYGNNDLTHFYIEFFLLLFLVVLYIYFTHLFYFAFLCQRSPSEFKSPNHRRRNRILWPWL